MSVKFYGGSKNTVYLIAAGYELYRKMPSNIRQQVVKEAHRMRKEIEPQMLGETTQKALIGLLCAGAKNIGDVPISDKFRPISEKVDEFWAPIDATSPMNTAQMTVH